MPVVDALLEGTNPVEGRLVHRERGRRHAQLAGARDGQSILFQGRLEPAIRALGCREPGHRLRHQVLAADSLRERKRFGRVSSQARGVKGPEANESEVGEDFGALLHLLRR
jgi:hypothetical protein